MSDVSPSSENAMQFDWREHLRQGRYREAMRLYRLAVDTQVDVEHEGVHGYLSWLSRLEGLLHDKSWRNAEDLANAERPDVPQGDAEFPDVERVTHEALLLSKSGAALDQRNPESAKPLLEELAAHAIFMGEALAQRGTLAIMEADDETARQYLEEAVRSYPQHLRARVNLGNLMLESGDVTGAIEAYEAALAMDDQYPSALHNLGVAYRRSGNIAKSVRTLRRAAGAQRKSDTRSMRRNASTGSPARQARWLWFVLIAAGIVTWLLVR